MARSAALMSDKASHMVSIRYDDVPYRVPAGRTILSALEMAGLGLIRGVGCRGGVCGACGVLYRIRGSNELTAALMCQEEVQADMEILPLPHIPQKKARHDLSAAAGDAPGYAVLNHYQEVNNCIMCRECSRICPVGIDVLSYVGMIQRRDLKGAARESFTCVQCGICVLRCPSRISQPNAALAARRYHGRFEEARAEHLARALEKRHSGRYEPILRRLRRMEPEAFQALYQRREREPDDAPPGTWLPEDRSLL